MNTSDFIRRAWIGATLALACGDSGTGDGGAATTGTSIGAMGTTTSAVDTSTGDTPTTGGSQSASGTTSTGSTSDTADTTGPIDPTTASPDPDTTTDTTAPGTTADATTTTSTTSTTTTDPDATTGTTTDPIACPPLLTACDGVCVDTEADPDHCGGCDTPCALDEACDAGACVALVCEPNAASPCYSGPPGTENVGLCTAGAATCNALGTALGPCVGEVLPIAEDCETDADDDCDGKTNGGCWLANCAAIKQAKPDAADGEYTIDLDGDDGPIPPFKVLCDMTTQGGGWTRFNWLHTDYTAGQDPLGQALQDCAVQDLQCRGRIPAGPVKDLLVKDLTDKVHAMWTFNGSTISNAVLAALQSKVQYCGANQGAFNPAVNTSQEAYCGTGQEGGCDSFFYTSGACNNVGNWGIHWDGDGAWCAAAFKMGATSGGCGSHGDQGFLNECACDDEKGELYYR